MKVLLDTNAYCALLRGIESVVNRVTRAQEVLLSTVVAGELIFGFRQGTRPGPYGVAALWTKPMYMPPIQNPEQITKDPTLLAIKPWWVVLLGAAILYLVPAQAVLTLPVLGASVEWLTSLIPSIARWTELSPFPANTKLFAIFVWLMIPVQAYWLWSSKESHQAFCARMGVGQVSRTRLMIDLLRSLLVLFPFLVIGYMFAIVDTPPSRVCVNTVGWAQLFIGCIYSLALSMLGAMCAWQASLVFKSISSRGNDHG